MPTTITPGATPGWPASYAAPADGDNCDAASVNVAFQALMDAAESARIVARAARRPPRVACTDGDAVTVGALGAFAVTSGGTWRSVASSVSVGFSAATKLGAAKAANTRYYVYAGLVAGVLDFLVTTTVPDAQRLYRSGGTDWAYVSTFLTDVNGDAVPFAQQGGMYRYQDAYWGVASPWPTLAVSAALGTSAKASASVGSIVPPHADCAYVNFSVGAGTPATDGAIVYQDGNSVARYAASYSFTLPCLASTVNQKAEWVALSGGTFSWSRANCTFAAHVLGWMEG